MTQIFLFSTISGTVSEAYSFAIVVATLAYLIPYLVSTLYQLKLVITGETYDILPGFPSKRWNHYYISVDILHLGYQNGNC